MAANTDYREYCLSLKGRQCEICGTTEQIVVHHLDGDRTNNTLENLIPVCRKHHAQIHYGVGGLEEYTDKLPDEFVHRKSSTSGRKTVTLNADAYEALADSKLEEESWSDFAWRMASVLNKPEGADADLSSADGMDDFAEQIADLTAQRLGERLLSANQ
jgi:hypothetical protein